MALIVIDRQHTGVPSRSFRDTGAWGDFDRDGRPDVVEQETWLTAVYGLALELKLREHGHTVVVLSDGSYVDRHRRAKAYRADIYIALHCNAGGGKYGLVVADHRSSRGKVLAGEVAEVLAQACPELSEVKADVTDGINSWPRAWACINGVQDGTPTGILVEPFFVDCPLHQGLSSHQGLERVGTAIADGVHRYLVGIGKV